VSKGVIKAEDIPIDKKGSKTVKKKKNPFLEFV
jgi:hypothetical protein